MISIVKRYSFVVKDIDRHGRVRFYSAARGRRRSALAMPLGCRSSMTIRRPCTSEGVTLTPTPAGADARIDGCAIGTFILISC